MNITEKISETAIIVASLRALSNFEEDPMLNCNDPYAGLFLPEEKGVPIKDHKTRELIKKAIPKGMYEYVIARTKYFDLIFNRAVNQEFRQIVLLGAGFDSRPYRFGDVLNRVKVFEVDMSATQKYKLSLLKDKTDLARKVKYVSSNFEENDLFERLKQHGYSQEEKTMFLWEGVTFYISRVSVIRMLMEIRNNSAPGSQICFDFQTIGNTDGLIKTGIEEETIKFGIEEGHIRDFVESNQYDLIEHLSSTSIEQKFFIGNNGELLYNIAPIMNFILIEH
jgi:methyltransferase (TIGR00027 family)